VDLVEILITGKNLSKTAFNEARADGASLGKVMAVTGVAAGAALVGIGVAAVKMATTYQSSTTRLVTSAGESVKNIDMVRKGMLSMAGQVGVSADHLSQAMYYVEAAGFHAADGLVVLKAAAQGAAAEGADTTTVAKALTDVLVDYHMKASSAADVTSQMVVAISHGKTNLQDFSGAFASIVPAASAAGISFKDVAAALAEMTNHGFTANRASQNLAQALRSMLNPTSTMRKAYDEYGGSLAILKEKLNGPNGLTDAMEYANTVALKAGKEGTPAYAAALKMLMGTAPGANAALATTGENFSATAATIAAVGGATADASGKVQGFALVQQTLGQQIKQINAGFDAMMIRLGTALIPTLSKLITMVQGGVTPAFKAFGDAVSGIASGFTGHTSPHAAAALQPARGQMQRGDGGAVALPAPDLTVWQKVGKLLAGVVSNVESFVGDLVVTFKNLLTAIQPTAVLLGGAFLVALQVTGAILANVLGPALEGVSGFLSHNTGLIEGAVIGWIAFKGAMLGFQVATMAVNGAITIVRAATVAWTVVQAVFNAVMDANPIMLVVIAVAALVAGAIYCYNHFKIFRDVINGAFNVVKIAAGWLAITAINAFKFMLDVWMTVAGGILHGAAVAFGWLPGLGTGLKAADKAFQGLKAGVDSSLNSALATVHGFVDGANNALSGIKNKTVTITFNGVNQGSLAGSGYTSTTGFSYAHGGVVSAAASGGIRNGMVLVGEYGPELVHLPGGSMVYSNSQSRSMAASQAAGGGGVLQVEWVGGNAGDEFMKWLRSNIRITHGGDVQKALGYGN